MFEDRRPPEPRSFEIEDDRLQQIAARFRCPPQMLSEAIERVGSNPIAVELYLAAPRP